MDIPFSGRLKTIISCKSRQYGHCFYESVKRSNLLFKIVGSQLFLRITWDNYLVLVEIIANMEKAHLKQVRMGKLENEVPRNTVQVKIKQRHPKREIP